MPSKYKTVRNTNVAITFQTVVGVNYDVEYATDYDAPVWAALAGHTNIPGTGAPVTRTDNSLGAVGGATTERFYRIKVTGSSVTSPNVVGMVRIAACPAIGGSKMVGLPLMPINNALSDVVGWQMGGGTGAPTADMISTWKGGTYVDSILIDLNAPDVNDSAYDGVWYNNKTGAVSADTIDYGEGFWVTTKKPTQYIYVEGFVPDVAASEPIPASGQVLLGWPYPDGSAMNLGAVDNINFDLSGGVVGANYSAADSIYLRDCGAAYRIMWLNPTGGWQHEGVGLSAETLDSTEGYWVKRGLNAAGTFNWSVPKPYAYP